MNYKYKLQILDSMVYTKSSLTFLFQKKKKKKKKKKKHKERKKNEKNKKGKTKNAFARLFTFKLSKKIIKK